MSLQNKTIGFKLDELEKHQKLVSPENICSINPMDMLSNIFENSNLPIPCFLDTKNNNIMTRNNHYEPAAEYPLSHLSDRERNTLVISCDILYAEPGALIILDEPEKYLYKRIVSPLLANLIETRKDCKFVISIHELTLPSFV